MPQHRAPFRWTRLLFGSPRNGGLAIGLCAALLAVAPHAAAQQTAAETNVLPPPLPSAFSKPVPESVSDLKDIQRHVQKLIARVMPLTVGLRVGTSQGSGVIISKEGYILTAAHVSGKADQVAEIILYDGRKIKGKTLGSNRSLDSGLVRITEPGTWMHANLARAADVQPGTWCLALGHPLGYRDGRPPVARLGRILERGTSYLRSDCPLVGGDSGGPLFDMNGNVIGIHSRIGPLMSANIHIPSDTFSETWDRLAKGEVWGSSASLFDHGYLGLRVDFAGRVTHVDPASPADKAGIKVNDVVLKFDGGKIASGAELDLLLGDKLPGTEVSLQVRRGDSTFHVRLTLTKR